MGRESGRSTLDTSARNLAGELVLDQVGLTCRIFLHRSKTFRLSPKLGL